MKNYNLNSECFVCKNQNDNYDNNDLLCTLDTCSVDVDLRNSERSNFISILPKSKSEIELSHLPPLFHEKHNEDLFAITSLQEFKDDEEFTDENREKLQTLLPYKKDILSESYNLKCGNPVLLKSVKFQTELSNVDESYILDFSTFLWSNTLKDPRSWAIINSAIEQNITNLALWTAGNAGYSLSKIAHTLNKFLNNRKRIKVFNVYDSMNEEVEPEITFNIKMNNGIIEGIMSDGNILSPSKIHEIISNKYSIEKDDFWVVTDGLEGVGNEIYKLIFLQVLSKLKPSHIFIPIGTGNLFIAAFRALEYLISKKILPITTKLIGAVPYGNNIYNDIINNSKTANPKKGVYTGKTIDSTNTPEMPKLTGEYSPLRQCIKHSLNEDFIDIEIIDRKSQDKAHTALSKDMYKKDVKIKFEPSSLAGFGALLNYQEKDIKISKALVINTGSGNMGGKEIEYLKN